MKLLVVVPPIVQVAALPITLKLLEVKDPLQSGPVAAVLLAMIERSKLNAAVWLLKSPPPLPDPAVLFAIVTCVSEIAPNPLTPPSAAIAPPRPVAVLPENVLLVMVSGPIALAPDCRIAPPSCAELPTNVLFVMVSVPWLRVTPPSRVAALPENVVLLMVVLPRVSIAAESPSAVLFETTALSRIAVALVST
ncbi:MAG TPA: hypothetical protein VFJ86_14875 [Usitatibacter sp.]|nr:hypothetical protein [Usitatibacter sp.]